jgi:hypothetical protein
LELAIQIIDPEDGVIAIDDFRAAHTPGVSAAIWMQIASKKILPVAITGTKMYCMRNTDRFQRSDFLNFLAQSETQFEIEHFLDLEVVRIYGKSEDDIFDNFNPSFKSSLRKIIKDFIPPVLVRSVRKRR